MPKFVVCSLNNSLACAAHRCTRLQEITAAGCKEPLHEVAAVVCMKPELLRYDFNTNTLSGPMLKSKSIMLRLGRKPCRAWNT